jgi:hypothetical protein
METKMTKLKNELSTGSTGQGRPSWKELEESRKRMSEISPTMAVELVSGIRLILPTRTRVPIAPNQGK